MTFADDAGEYTIVIRNKHGETSASASLLEEGECNSKQFHVHCKNGNAGRKQRCVIDYQKSCCSIPVLMLALSTFALLLASAV